MKEDILTAYKDYIDKIIPISREIWNEMKGILKPKELVKDEFIVKEDQKFNKEIFVYKGVIRGFYDAYSGDEINVTFYQDNELICPYFARTTNGRSNINLQAITPAIIFEAKQDAMKTLRHKYSELIFYSSKVVENELREKTQHEIFLLTRDRHDHYLLLEPQKIQSPLPLYPANTLHKQQFRE